jgi:hypothetical protein
MGLGHGTTFAEGMQIAPGFIEGGIAPVSEATAQALGPGVVGEGALGTATGANLGDLAKTLKQGQQLVQPQEQEPQNQQISQLPPQPQPTAPQPSQVQPQVGMDQLLLRLMMQRMSPGQGIAGAL